MFQRFLLLSALVVLVATLALPTGITSAQDDRPPSLWGLGDWWEKEGIDPDKFCRDQLGEQGFAALLGADGIGCQKHAADGNSFGFKNFSKEEVLKWKRQGEGKLEFTTSAAAPLSAEDVAKALGIFVLIIVAVVVAIIIYKYPVILIPVGIILFVILTSHGGGAS